MAPNGRSISVFFPAFNDARTLPTLVASVDDVLRQFTDQYEIIVVNDASVDDTEEVLEDLTRRFPRLRVVRHAENQGYGGALRSGFAEARHEFVFYTDGDAQYDPSELATLLDNLSESVDVVQGYKIARHDPLYRIVLGRWYKRVVSFAFGLSVRDVNCDFRLIRRSVFDQVELKLNSGAICVELVKKIQDAGFRFVEVPVHHYRRPYGKSQAFEPRHIVKVLVDLARLWREVVLKR